MSDSPAAALIVDIHLDLAMNALEWNRDLRWSLERLRRSELIASAATGRADRPDRTNNTVCFPEMRKGRVGLCVATQIARVANEYHTLPGWRSPEQAWAHTQGQLAWYRAMEACGELRPIRNRQELDHHIAEWLELPRQPADWQLADSRSLPSVEPIGYILSLEGADSIVTLDYLHRSYEAGLRALGPAHYGPGRYAMGTDARGPLTPQGRELLQEMRQLGILLDVTHLCDQTFWDVIDFYDGPLWASHQNCRRLAPWNRQFADDQIAVVIERGGILGMALDAIMMVPDWKHKQSLPRDFGLKLERICDHVDHVCQIAGNARHVCIGTDLMAGMAPSRLPGPELDRRLAECAGAAGPPRLFRGGHRRHHVEECGQLPAWHLEVAARSVVIRRYKYFVAAAPLPPSPGRRPRWTTAVQCPGRVRVRVE